jgi:2'-5' RNA ligase
MRRRIESAAAALDLPRDVRLVPTESYHMTLAFAGEVSSAQAAALRSTGAAVHSPAFEICFDAYEHWQKAEVIVAAASECPAALRELTLALRTGFRRVGLAADPVPFRAHVTIARKVAQAPVLKAMSKFSWAVTEFQLARSVRSDSGSVYTVIDNWQLLDKAPSVD